MLVIALVPLFIIGCNTGATGNVVSDKAIVESEEYVKISLSDLSSTVKFYEYNDDGLIISYFAVLGNDGKPRTAFDACDVCGGKQGYRQEGSDIVCNKCGRFFDIDGLGTENKGYGCWPSYLPHVVQDGEIFIKINDIKNGRHRFA